MCGGSNVKKKRAACHPSVSLSQILYSQANGSFTGTVSDKTGSVVSGATVKILSQSTGLSREAKTDESGHFLVPLLPVSIYSIRVESPGFQTRETKGPAVAGQ